MCSYIVVLSDDSKIRADTYLFFARRHVGSIGNAIIARFAARETTRVSDYNWVNPILGLLRYRQEACIMYNGYNSAFRYVGTVNEADVIQMEDFRA